MLDYRPGPDLSYYSHCDGKAIALVWQLWEQIMKFSGESFTLDYKGEFLRKVLEWLSNDGEDNPVIESLNSLIKLIQQQDEKDLKNDSVQSKLQDLKEALNMKDISLSDCKEEKDDGDDSWWNWLWGDWGEE